MAYLGEEGWCLGAELRPGSQHCQDEFDYFLDRVLPRAKRLLLGSGKRLLVRLDGGHDARPNLARFIDEEVEFLIKWNPRSVKRSFWREYVEKEGIAWEEVRPGYRVAHFSITVTYKGKGRQYQFRRIMRLVEITQDSKGQILLVPDIKIEGWWTSLDLPEKEIIKLYAERGTSEQFHSEFKTDMDIERLPSGKFDTNDLVLTFAALAYNILRMIGQMGMLGELAPVRHRAKRRRIRTVIQELIYLATRIVRSGRRWKLVFGKVCAGFAALENVYEQLTPG
jgi:hypothetical protein